MTININSKLISLTFGVLVLLFAVGYHIIIAWTEPTVAPPGANVPAPLNVGPVHQTRVGPLTIQAGLLLNTGNATTGLIVQHGNVGIGTVAPGARLDVQGGNIRATAIPAGQIGTYTWNRDIIQVCQFGFCCGLARDCDGDGRTYGAGTDCDEFCATCFVGSTAYTTERDGRDQNCNGEVDEIRTITDVLILLNSGSMKCCDRLCAAHGGRCASVGDDAGGTNGAIHHVARDAAGIPYCRRGIGDAVMGCRFSMWPEGRYCGGFRAAWSRCRCLVDRRVFD
jgi:hypothetical protein